MAMANTTKTAGTSTRSDVYTYVSCLMLCGGLAGTIEVGDHEHRQYHRGMRTGS